MPKVPLDTVAVRNARCPSNQARLDLYDTVITGFMLEIRQSGLKTYYLRYRNVRGIQKQVRIGDAQTLTFKQAKNIALRYKTRLLLGEDIVEQKKP